MPNLKVLLIFLWATSSVFATTFVPSSFNKQVRESNGAIWAEYVGETFKMMPNEEVMTEATFKVIKSAGLNHSEVSNRNNFKVLYPGGEWDGLVYHIEGAPRFKRSEKVFLLLNKNRYGYQIRSLGLGKYNIVEDKNGSYISSSIFPRHQELGKISLSKINRVLQKYIGSPLVSMNDDRSIYKYEKVAIKKNTKKKSRGIASVEPVERKISSTDKDDSNVSIIWFVLLFSFMGIVTTVRRSRKR